MQYAKIGPFNLYELFAFFFVYSFLGWIVEVAYHAVTTGKFVNRGFLNGPICPIYGAGVTAIVLMLCDVLNKTWAVALVGLAFPTAIELLTGWALEKFFHNKWWDYSDRKFNFKGYVCLEFSLLWAIAVIFVIEIVHPLTVKFVSLADNVTGTALVSVCIGLLVIDIIVTVLQALELNKQLKEIDGVAKVLGIGGEIIGKGVTAATLAVENGIDRVKQKRDDAVDAIVKKMPKRFLKAFPRLASKTSPNSVELAKESMARKKTKKHKISAPNETDGAETIRNEKTENDQ